MDATEKSVGEAVGGISGVLAGAAIGSAAGPIGTIVGGIAGAVGGWWAGHAVAEAAGNFTHTDDDFFRQHYETLPNRPADRRYDDVRPAYQLGHLASQNPDYAGRDFGEIESDLQRGWSDSLARAHGKWGAVRGSARVAYARGQSALKGAAMGAAMGASELAREGAERALNAIDDVKDRIDGDPASMPGPNPTDARR